MRFEPPARPTPAQKLAAARELVRSAGIHDEAGLLQALQNIHGATSFVSQRTKELLDLITDLDGDVHYPPELSSFDQQPGEVNERH